MNNVMKKLLPIVVGIAIGGVVAGGALSYLNNSPVAPSPVPRQSESAEPSDPMASSSEGSSDARTNNSASNDAIADRRAPSDHNGRTHPDDGRPHDDGDTAPRISVTDDSAAPADGGGSRETALDASVEPAPKSSTKPKSRPKAKKKEAVVEEDADKPKSSDEDGGSIR